MTNFLIEAQQIPTADRYLFIFKTFENLAFGESLTIQYDSDPLPSLLQLTDLKSDDFTYEYIENGPKNWLVKIRKTKKEGCCGCCGN